MAVNGTPTNGDDFILGDIFDNHINALEGDDVVFGNKGNDFITDSSSVNSGDDYFTGDHGNDTLWGWAGNDELNGGADNDYLDGYSGKAFSVEYDVLTGGSHPDSPFGNGNDIFGLGYSGYPMYYQGDGFAMITDFRLGDKIQLGGSAGDYKLTYEDLSSVGTMSGYNTAGTKDTVIRSAFTNDVVGIVEDTNIVNSNVFIYV